MKHLLPDPTWSAVPLIVGAIIFLVLFLYNDPLLLLGGNGNGHKAQILTIPQGVTELISELRSTASDIKINNEEETKKWKEQHPCRSRDKLNLLYQQKKHGEILMKNPNWERVYREYSNLHSRCMRKVGNVSQYFHSQNNSISDCKFVVPALYYGLGNKVLWFTSCLLYAILTKRVLLIPASTSVPDIMCEPFTGSSWRLEDDHSLINSQIWTRQAQVVEAMDQAAKNKTRITSIYAAELTDEWQPHIRFFCNTGQDVLKDVPWLFFRGCLYFLPGLFATRPFRPILESLFPDKMALTHMLRSVMLPADSVWQRIDRFHELYIKNAERLVGIQVRYRYGATHYKGMNTVINSRVTTCATENELIPRTLNSAAMNGNETSKKGVTNVFIACLFTGLRDHLNNMYMRNPTENGEVVGIIQPTAEWKQGTGVEEDRQALTEVIVLSLADNLLVTPLSTFGGLAQAYGALLPWFINYGKNEQEGACVRGHSVDVCYQEGPVRYSCPFDEEEDRLISETVPYYQSCLAVDCRGVKLITSMTPTPRA